MRHGKNICAERKLPGGNCVDTNEGSYRERSSGKRYFAISQIPSEGYKDAAIVVLRKRRRSKVPAFTREQTES